jgi:hypothetical protein
MTRHTFIPVIGWCRAHSIASFCASVLVCAAPPHSNTRSAGDPPFRV